MNFSLTDEERLIQESARDFASKVLLPVAGDHDDKGILSREIIEKMGDAGLLGIAIPEEYGGSGASYTSYVLAVIEITRVSPSYSMTLALHNSLVAWPLMTFGSDSQKERYLKPCVTGEKLCAFALTEPEAGSDAGNMKTTARKSGDTYVLNGTKLFITNGSVADFLIVFASTDPARRGKGISAFVVDKNAPGFRAGGLEKKMGLCGSLTAELIFEDCVIPADALLGKEGDGLKIAFATLDGGRIGVAAQAIGMAESAYRAAVEYSKTRTQFGQSISNFQAVQWMISEMTVLLECSKALTLRAAWLKGAGMNCTKESAQCKLFASEAGTRICHIAIQVHGGYGYMEDYPVEKPYRDIRVTEIFEGTSEIQRLVIASSFLREN